ncbi:MAG: hypothetical protein AB7T59_17805 [Hyphomonadaceae bacterium]
MRHWLFHPILFYPLMALLAVFVVALSLQPQSWPRDPAPVTAARDGEWLVWSGEAFDTPSADERHEIMVVRDFFGRAQNLRIAQKASGEPAPEERGARILLSPEDAAALQGRRLTVEVSYNPLPVNAAPALAVAAGGDGPTAWVRQDTPPQPATLRFQLPAQSEVNAIALRAISAADDQAYGLEITRIRISPQT